MRKFVRGCPFKNLKANVVFKKILPQSGQITSQKSNDIVDKSTLAKKEKKRTCLLINNGYSNSNLLPINNDVVVIGFFSSRNFIIK